MDANEIREMAEALPDNAKDLLAGKSDSEVEAMFSEGQRMLEDIEEFLISITGIYALNSNKRRREFKKWLRSKRNDKDFPTKWGDAILALSDHYLLLILAKIVSDCHKRTAIRRQFANAGQSVMPVRIPGITDIIGGLIGVSEDYPEKPEETYPPKDNGPYL